MRTATLMTTVSALGITSLSAIADVLWDNGQPNGTGGYSNATAGVFGFRRTLLDDFLIDHDGTRVQGMQWNSVWGTPMGFARGTGMDLSFRSDLAGAPGAIIAVANVTAYAEEYTGNIFFSREEVTHWVTFGDVVLDAGKYWWEAAVVGPENNFWLTADQQLDECWVNYQDLGGFVSGTDQFGVASDLNFIVSGVFAACTADLDGDAEVAFSDLLLVLGAWGPCPPSGCPEDLDGSGAVDFGDLIVVLAHWGGLCGPAPMGACCARDQTCTEVTHAVCRSQDGSFIGNGTVCVDGCPGACCFDDTTCIDATIEADCVAMGGTFEGEGVTCADIECPSDPVGACCLDDGTCLEPASEANCRDAGGRFQGSGSTCADATCHVLGPCGWIIDAPLTWVGNTCDEDATCALQPSRDIQWAVTVPHGGDWTFSVCGAEGDTVLYADTDECCGDAFENDNFCGDDAQLTLNLLSGQVVFLTLETRSFIACGDFTLIVSD